jgi:hypothetical protein
MKRSNYDAPFMAKVCAATVIALILMALKGWLA